MLIRCRINSPNTVPQGHSCEPHINQCNDNRNDEGKVTSYFNKAGKPQVKQIFFPLFSPAASLSLCPPHPHPFLHFPPFVFFLTSPVWEDWAILRLQHCESWGWGTWGTDHGRAHLGFQFSYGIWERLTWVTPDIPFFLVSGRAHLALLSNLPKKSQPFLQMLGSSTPSSLQALAWWSTSRPQAPPALGQTSVIPRVILKLEGHSVSPRKQTSTSCLHSDRDTGASFPGHSAGSQNSSSCKFHENKGAPQAPLLSPGWICEGANGRHKLFPSLPSHFSY